MLKTGPSYKRGSIIVTQMQMDEAEDLWEVMILDLEDTMFHHSFGHYGKLTATEAKEKLDELLGTKQMTDNVNHPTHYTRGDIECIDAIRACMTPPEFEGFCKGNAIKYIWREKRKNGTEDLRKALWYLSKLIEERKPCDKQ